MEEEPELTYWKPAPKAPPAPLKLPPPPPPPSAVYSQFPPGPCYLMPLPPSGLCYPVTDVHTFNQHQQSGCQLTDNLIQEEVTRAAKTLFSKRNRTLMHWLNPDISMNQLKMEVNAAWECLPATEKVFYISQVLGKFAPHTTSLMVNPQLDPTISVGMSAAIKTEKIDSSVESGVTVSKKRQKTSSVTARKPRALKRRVENSSDDDASCDSGLVVDMDRLDGQRVKRKYTKRKVTGSTEQGQGANDCSNSCPLPVAVENIKVEPGTETVPRVKRKYVKRKLVRKKYKKRGSKNTSANDTQEEVVTSSVPEPQPQAQARAPEEDMSVWIELDDSMLSKEIDDFKLSSEEVDNFWASIDDPSKFFIELEIE